MSDAPAPRVDAFTREVVGVAAGYVAIPLVTMLGTIVATRMLDASEIIVRAGDTVPTARWLAVSVALGAAASLAAGALCGAIARTRRASLLLAGIVLSMGLVLALPVLRAGPGAPDDPGAPPTVEVSAPSPATAAFRAAMEAEPPRRWLLWKPIVSALLVVAGARAVSVRE